MMWICLQGPVGDVARAVVAANAGMTVEEYLKSKEEEDGERTEIKRHVVAIIEILLPYEVSKSTAIKMLGYRLTTADYSEDGFWQDKESGDMITVTHGDLGKRWVLDLKTRIIVSAGGTPPKLVR